MLYLAYVMQCYIVNVRHQETVMHLFLLVDLLPTVHAHHALCAM